MTSAVVRVSRATRSEGGAVQELLRAQFAEHGIALDDELLAAGIEGHFADPSRGAVLVARRSDEVIAFAVLATIWTLEHGGRVAWLEELYVLPHYRNDGVGTELLAHALDTARELGCRAVDLEVDAGHARAENMYVRAGFRRLPRTRWALSL